MYPKQKEKSNVKKALLDGQIDVLVGTHAVLEDNVVFKNLFMSGEQALHLFRCKKSLFSLCKIGSCMFR